MTTEPKQDRTEALRGEEPESRIVVGVDGSLMSKAALRWAAAIAPGLGARIEAVAAWQYPTNYGWAVSYPSDWRPEADAQKMLDETIDEAFGINRPAELTTAVVQGHPAAVLIEESRHAAMLVVGSRGHGGFVGMLLGSVSADCAEHAKCPVLVVHRDRS